MSVLDKNSIDLIFCEDDNVFLGISDHLPWNDDTVEEHWLILMDKLKAYFGYISSGQCNESYPNKKPCVIIYFSYPWNDVIDKYLNKIREINSEYNIGLDWVYDPQDEND